MLRSLARFISGMAGKLVVVGTIALSVWLALRWYRDCALSRFCKSPVVGLSRRAVAERAGKAGLRVWLGDKKDEVVGSSQSVGLSWCVLGHDGTKVTSAKFVRERLAAQPTSGASQAEGRVIDAQSAKRALSRGRAASTGPGTSVAVSS